MDSKFIERLKQHIMSELTLNEYQERTESTAIYGNKIRDLVGDTEGAGKLIPLMELLYAGLGLGEAGEVQNKIKKILRDNNGVVTDEMREAIMGELGGVLYYVARVSLHIGASLEAVAQYNLDQLQERKKKGTIQGSGDNR